MFPRPIFQPATAIAVTATWDPGNMGNQITLSGGDLTATKGSAATQYGRSTNSHSAGAGKWYYEYTMTHINFAPVGPGCGLVLSTQNTLYNSRILGNLGNDSIEFRANGDWIVNNSATSLYGNLSDGDVVGNAYDFVNNKAWWRINGGNWNNSGSDDPSTNTGGVSLPSGLTSGTIFAGISMSDGTEQTVVNFGATAFGTTPPSGFDPWGYP